MKKFSVFLAFVLVLICCFSFVACEEDIVPPGPAGADGANGKSAYEIWLDQGYTGSQLDFLEWLRGDDGSAGNSAYDIWLAEGHEGTTADFLEWLKGAAGKDGSSGSRGSTGAKGEKGDDGEDSPYGAMAVEVTTAREFLDALNLDLKKKLLF